MAIVLEIQIVVQDLKHECSVLLHPDAPAIGNYCQFIVVFSGICLHISS